MSSVYIEWVKLNIVPSHIRRGAGEKLYTCSNTFDYTGNGEGFFSSSPFVLVCSSHFSLARYEPGELIFILFMYAFHTRKKRSFREDLIMNERMKLKSENFERTVFLIGTGAEGKHEKSLM
jgi:hypothetical protein